MEPKDNLEDIRDKINVLNDENKRNQAQHEKDRYLSDSVATLEAMQSKQDIDIRADNAMKKGAQETAEAAARNAKREEQRRIEIKKKENRKRRIKLATRFTGIGLSAVMLTAAIGTVASAINKNNYEKEVKAEQRISNAIFKTNTQNAINSAETHIKQYLKANGINNVTSIFKSANGMYGVVISTYNGQNKLPKETQAPASLTSEQKMFINQRDIVQKYLDGEEVDAITISEAIDTIYILLPTIKQQAQEAIENKEIRNNSQTDRKPTQNEMDQAKEGLRADGYYVSDDDFEIGD